MARILVADDEPRLGKLVVESLGLDGHEVIHAGGGQAALAALSSQPFDVVVTDLRMPEVDGFAVLRRARTATPPAEVILMTAHATAASASEARRAGAADYLVKPFSFDELRMRVRRIASQRKTAGRGQRPVEQVTPGLVAGSAAMAGALASARLVAATDATVLLLGESGTGKSELARFIHFNSPRADGPLVEVHCAALPEALLESELFGHEKGAFTGASERTRGHLEASDRGSLFLDEIGELTQANQVKLLRFLQRRELVPVGSTQPRKVDARIIAATNRDLAAAVKSGRFREDFYFRLNVFSIHVPALRERRAEIAPLAERFLSLRGLPAAKLSRPAREEMLRRTWPGNVRELENALERALILAGEDDIRPEHLGQHCAPARGASGDAGSVLREGFNLDQFERDLVSAALERAGGNKTAAARLLGITRRRLYSMLQSFANSERGEPDESE